jgi:CRP-like cAMP-binding protein
MVREMVGTDELRANAILAQLPEREFVRLSDQAQILDAQVREQLYRPGEPITEVMFPLTSVYSLVATADRRVLVEVATIGREGMAGLPLFLGATSSPQAAFCQVAGRAVRLSAVALREILGDDGVLHRVLNRFTQATMVQISQNVVCNATHTTSQRAARWLLTTQDRVGRDEFDLTQEFLAQMLGVQRPTVSETARRLHTDGLISYRRGTLTILDRQGLERIACTCYGIVHAEFEAMTRSD